MLTLFYSPHSTSTDNEAGRASGHADVPLSALGHERASVLGHHYAVEAIDAVFCSDLQRAYTTAEIAFAGRGLPIIRDARLRECDYGDWTQYPRDQICHVQHVRESYPNGESLEMAVERVGRCLDDLLGAYDGGRVVVIGHAVTRWGIEYRTGTAALEAVVAAPWEWLDVPIWRYQLGDAVPKTS